MPLRAGFTGAVSAFAPAKVNLYLHVIGRRADGYHLLDSLIAFADIGDRVTARAADTLSLALGGPEADAIGALGDDNLVLRAARLLAEVSVRRGRSGGHSGAALFLEKVLPTSSGIGGGSSDAAATLRVLDHLWNTRLSAAALADLGVTLGADVPACLAVRPVWVTGIGEHLEPADGLPAAGIVLANPRRGVPTAAVFQARRGPFTEPDRFAPLPGDAAALAATLATRRNDLTEAALSLAPEIGSVLECLAALPGALLARMSGSGATCFALFVDRAAALAAHANLKNAEPGWWSSAGALMANAPPIEEDPPG